MASGGSLSSGFNSRCTWASINPGSKPAGGNQNARTVQGGGPGGAEKKKVASYEVLYCYKDSDGWKIVLSNMLGDPSLTKLKNKDFVKMGDWYKGYITRIKTRDKASK